MNKQKVLIYLVALLFGFAGLNMLRSCRSGRPPPVREADRQAHCGACGKTFPLPIGYLATLQSHEIQTLPNGQRIFACPKCGALEAAPVMPTLPTLEQSAP